MVLVSLFCIDGCLVGWRDLAIFAILPNGLYAANQVYFYESNSKKLPNLAAQLAECPIVFFSKIAPPYCLAILLHAVHQNRMKIRPQNRSISLAHLLSQHSLKSLLLPNIPPPHSSKPPTIYFPRFSLLVKFYNQA